MFVAKARAHAQQRLPHHLRSYTFVVDYGQNMELPVFNHNQPGCTYYYPPLGIFNLGVVNHAHDYGNGEFKEHMYAHVYHEGDGKKGANNVASLIFKTLQKIGILRENEMGGELNIVFDNCSGQNKNNTILKLVSYLTEMGYFKKVNFIFLIVGHTKNAADRLFNILKYSYRKSDIFTMPDLCAELNKSECVTVIPAVEGDFKDWDQFLNLYYSDFKRKVKHNHIFSCTHGESREANQMMVDLRKSDLPEHTIVRHKSFKQGFYGRSNYPKNVKGLKLAIENRVKDIKAARAEKLQVIPSPGINIFKQVELYTKYKRVVPEQFWNEDLYSEPDEKIIKAVKKERKMRKEFKTELNEDKKKLQLNLKAERKTELELGAERKRATKEKIEKMAYC